MLLVQSETNIGDLLCKKLTNNAESGRLCLKTMMMLMINATLWQRLLYLGVKCSRDKSLVVASFGLSFKHHKQQQQLLARSHREWNVSNLKGQSFIKSKQEWAAIRVASLHSGMYVYNIRVVMAMKSICNGQWQDQRSRSCSCAIRNIQIIWLPQCNIRWMLLTSQHDDHT